MTQAFRDFLHAQVEIRILEYLIQAKSDSRLKTADITFINPERQGMRREHIELLKPQELFYASVLNQNIFNQSTFNRLRKDGYIEHTPDRLSDGTIPNRITPAGEQFFNEHKNECAAAFAEWAKYHDAILAMLKGLKSDGSRPISSYSDAVKAITSSHKVDDITALCALMKKFGFIEDGKNGSYEITKLGTQYIEAWNQMQAKGR